MKIITQTDNQTRTPSTMVQLRDVPLSAMTSASNGQEKVGSEMVDFLSVCRRMKRKKSPRVNKRVGSVEGSTSSGASAVTPRQPTPPSTVDESRQSTQSAAGTSHSLPLDASLVASSLPPVKLDNTSEEDACNACNECQRFSEELEAIKTQFQGECAMFHQSLLDERFRFERLEEQMNDLIELHQNEIENLKQGIVDMEEKVQYQSEERLRDIHEMLESCQTRISRMEHQQHQHFQQLVNLDSLENSNARALVLKLINVLLIILQVVLLLVATVANIVTPFLKTRIHVLTTLILLVSVMLFFRQWYDISSWIRNRFGDRFPQLVLLLPNESDTNG